MFKKISLILALLSLGLWSQTSPCNCSTEFHGDFDFWVGEWLVTHPDGSAAGTNSIKKVQGNCVLMENWDSANQSYTGTSYNYYNLQTSQWEQLWIDNNGSHLKLSGSRTGDAIVMASEPITGDDGKEYVNRITWTANQDGSVRQLWEMLSEGKVIRVAFDGLYRRKK